MKKILSIIISFILFFPSYLISFLPNQIDTDFEILGSGYSDGCIAVNGENVPFQKSETDIITFDFGRAECGWFNYYGIKYESDAYIKGNIAYILKGEEYTEEFFLEPNDGTKPFYSFIDGILDKKKSNTLCKLTFEPLDKETAVFNLLGLGTFNREIPDKNVYIQNDEYKLGINLEWGGAMDYLEDLNSNVQTVKSNGKIYVDSNAAERYNTKAVNSNVNLINRHDTGRLVQQSYYGTFGGDYECGYYGENKWNYNPVQGGNQFNEASKIVDLIIKENYLYIKCRPLDWAKAAEHITPSYMEATYSLSKGLVEVSCRFVDFSGYESVVTTQELPAFYCIEPLNRFVYYSGNKPWTGDKNLSYENNLIFWPDAGYPMFPSTENWSAFTGEFDDSFGIGLYVPHNASFLAGVYARGETKETDPSVDVSTSYIAAVEWYEFSSFNPTEYNYYISTGSVDEIRSNFSTIKES